MRRFSRCLPWAVLLYGGTCRADEPVSLYYYERPPYMVARADGGAAGITADVAAKAFRRAGIPFVWEMMPAKRQLLTIQRNNGRACGVGWFKNPQREQDGQFSHAIYRDQPPVAIAREGFNPQAASLAQLLKQPGVQVLVKDSLTYGSYINGVLKTAKAKVTAVTVEQPQLVRMVAAGRADMMFAPREEADFLVTAHESGQESLHVMSFSDVTAGDARYLYCSKLVDAASMGKLNAAIDQIAP